MTAVKQQVGDELAPLPLEPISRTTLALFAGASGDFNPIHIDLDVAHSAGLDDVFCHGMLSMAYLGRLITKWVPQSHLRSFDVRFVSITPVHAQPTCRGKVTAVKVVGGRTVVTVAIDVVLADGTSTLSGVATVELPESA